MIFNALVIVALVPLALRGVRYRPAPAATILRRNLLVYGLGGLVVPFAGIKIDRHDTRLCEGRMTTIRNQLRSAICVTAVLMVVTGLVYPGIVTAVARMAFPEQADGSLLTRNGAVIGSALIGQRFSSARYFHSRPSAAGAGYDATASGGTNRGPTDRKLADTLIAQAVDSAVRLDGMARGSIPPDMVTSSASGLDPDISPASAQLQVARVARARGIDSAALATLVSRHVERRQFGILGEPRVNVLMLNLALDASSVTRGGGNR